MKKIMCVVLALALLYAMTACGNSGKGENSAIEPEPSTSASAPSGTEAEDAKEPDRKAEAEQAEPPPAEPARENTDQGATEMKMKIQIGDTTLTATLAEDTSVDAMKELMADGPLTLNMSDYANMEKGADLGVTLPQNNEQMNTQAGDIILHQGRTLVIYYDTNSWSLTPIAKIDDVDGERLKETLGTGDVTVTISLE